MLHRLKPPLEGRWQANGLTERCQGSSDSRKPSHNVLRYGRPFRPPLHPKSMVHRTKGSPVKGSWRAKRD